MKRTLLILDDEPVLIDLLRLMLRQYNLLEATTAQQALQIFADPDRPIDLLVADLSLPTSSGIQVALLLRAEIPNLPVILTSGYPVSAWGKKDTADLETLGSHSVAVLQKPFDVQELHKTIRELIGTSPTDMVRTA
jgi:two-component system, cell cycle sensor histidine kinase and response regulator CckA